jgi:heme A synthase
VTLRIALVLLTLQIVLGVLNVLWLLPTPLREAHAANAIAAFLAFVVATVFASLEEVKDPLFLGAPSQV